MISGQPEPFSRLRNVGDRLQIGGDVLADRAVAARRALHEHAVLVAQRSRQPVDLRLGREQDLAQLLRAREKPPEPLEEIVHVLVGIGLGKAEHGHRVAHLGKAFGRRRTDPPATANRRAPGRESAPRWRGCGGSAHRIRRRKSSARPRRDSGGRAPAISSARRASSAAASFSVSSRRIFWRGRDMALGLALGDSLLFSGEREASRSLQQIAEKSKLSPAASVAPQLTAVFSRSSRSAAARASSVMVAPASMRAISSCRARPVHLGNAGRDAVGAAGFHLEIR